MELRRITSTQNARVKAVVKLRDRRGRESQGRFIIDGLRELHRALAANVVLDEVFVGPAGLSVDSRSDLLDQIDSNNIPLTEVTLPVMEKITYGQRGEGVVAVAQSYRRELSDLSLPHTPLVAVLVGVEKPGNIGAVARSADAAGVSALVLVETPTDLFNPNVIRASIGTLFSLPVVKAGTDETIAWLKNKNLQIVTACVDAECVYTDSQLDLPTAIVLGSEDIGLSPRWQSVGTVPVRLPMCGIADSLNVSVTAAVLFYEALRQRTVAGQSL